MTPEDHRRDSEAVWTAALGYFGMIAVGALLGWLLLGL